MCVLTLKSSHRPDGIFTCFAHVLARLQGGGVYISSGTVSFSSCTITGNTAYNVRAYVRKCLCSCSKLPIAPMGKLLTRLP